MADLIPWVFLVPPLAVALVALSAMLIRRTAGSRALALLATGGRHINHGQLAEAEACFREGLELSPQHEGLTGMLASLLVEVGRYDEAAALLDTLTKSRPNDHALTVLAGRCAHGRGDTAGAAELWESVAPASTSYMLAQTHLAALHEAGGELALAIASLDRAIEAAEAADARRLKRSRSRLVADLEAAKA